VLYLAYENGVEGHPRDHEVELRLMNCDGGDVRILASIFGGQSSINVPNWSPDGRRFAFVRFARP
jgi:Tol biopolymer transport system component